MRVVIHNVFFVEEVIMIPRYMCGFGEISVNDSNCRFFRFLMCHFVPLTVSQYLVYCEYHFWLVSLQGSIFKHLNWECMAVIGRALSSGSRLTPFFLTKYENRSDSLNK